MTKEKWEAVKIGDKFRYPELWHVRMIEENHITCRSWSKEEKDWLYMDFDRETVEYELLAARQRKGRGEAQ